MGGELAIATTAVDQRSPPRRKHDTTRQDSTREEHRANGTEVKRARARGVEHSRRRERRGVFSLSTREGGRRRRRATRRSGRDASPRGGRSAAAEDGTSTVAADRIRSHRVRRASECALRTTRAARRTRGRDETTRVADLAEDGGGAEEDGKKTRFLIFIIEKKNERFGSPSRPSSVVRAIYLAPTASRASSLQRDAAIPPRPVASVASRQSPPPPPNRFPTQMVSPLGVSKKLSSRSSPRGMIT